MGSAAKRPGATATAVAGPLPTVIWRRCVAGVPGGGTAGVPLALAAPSQAGNGTALPSSRRASPVSPAQSSRAKSTAAPAGTVTAAVLASKLAGPPESAEPDGDAARDTVAAALVTSP